MISDILKPKVWFSGTLKPKLYNFIYSEKKNMISGTLKPRIQSDTPSDLCVVCVRCGYVSASSRLHGQWEDA